MTARFVAHLKANPDINLADAAYTLQVGRRIFPHRRMVVCRDVRDAIAVLEKMDAQRVVTRQSDAKDCPVVFMFPGQGAQYVNMGGRTLPRRAGLPRGSRPVRGDSYRADRS